MKEKNRESLMNESSHSDQIHVGISIIDIKCIANTCSKENCIFYRNIWPSNYLKKGEKSQRGNKHKNG